MPEFVLFLHKSLMNIKWNGTLKSENVTKVRPKSSVVDASDNDDGNLEKKMRSVLARLSRVEQDNIHISKKFDEIKNGIN